MDKETRKRNAEARKARREAQAAEQERDKALILDALRAVLKDPEATSAQRIYAVAVLENMQYYHFVPYDVRHLIQAADSAAIDAAIFECIKQAENE